MWMLIIQKRFEQYANNKEKAFRKQEKKTQIQIQEQEHQQYILQFEQALSELLNQKERKTLPRCFFTSLDQKIEELINLRKNDPHLMRLKQQLLEFRVDKQSTEKQLNNKFGKAFKQFEQMKAFLEINQTKEINKEEQIKQQNHLIVDLQNSIDNYVMINQIQNTDSNALIFLNQMLKSEKRQAVELVQQESEKQFERNKTNIKQFKDNQKEAKIISEILNSYLVNWVKISMKNLKFGTKEEKKVGKIQSVFAGKKQLISKDMISSLNYSLKLAVNKIKFGLSTQKIRQIIANHFLSMTLEKLEKTNLIALSPLDVINLQKFKKAILQCFPSDSCINQGRKYLQIGTNKFKNYYLRSILQSMPQAQEILRVKLEEEDQLRVEEVLFFSGNQQKLGDATSSPTRVNSAFRQNLQTDCFFKKAKRMELTQKDNSNRIFKAYKTYFNSLSEFEKNLLSIDPSIFTRLFHKGTLFLTQLNISLSEIICLSKFFIQLKDEPDFQIKKLIIDRCQFDDQTMSIVLDACISQTRKLEIDEYPESRIRKKQFLFSLAYINNQMGQETVNKIVKLSEGLIELKLSCIHFKPKKNSQEIIINLMDQIRYRSDYLMKFTLSEINLADDKVVEAICETILVRKNLQYLDLSSCSLLPRHLAKISQAISNLTKSIRDINFSYNTLYSFRMEIKIKISGEFEDELIDKQKEQKNCDQSENEQNSKQFIENIINLIKESKILNHINLSGMCLSKDYLREIFKYVSGSRLLMGIHLNDNGITSNFDFMLELIDMLGLDQDDIPIDQNQFSDFQAQDNPEINIKQREQEFEKIIKDRKQSQINWNKSRKRNSITFSNQRSSSHCGQSIQINSFQREIFDYKKTLKPYFRNFSVYSPTMGSTLKKSLEVSEVKQSQFTKFKFQRTDIKNTPKPDNEQKLIELEKQKNKNRFKFSQYALLSRELKEVEMEKAMNDCVTGYGLGRITHHLEVKDNFVLTRILNHPELCFNQRPKYDYTEPKNRFFQKDARSNWVLSPKNECFICDRYSYTQFTYERGIIALNHGLEEIQDEEILKKLNYHFKKNQLEFRNKAPLICGTVIQKRNFNSCNFERRLKMIRAQVFSLLSVVGSQDFSDNYIHLSNIKDGCQKYLTQDDQEMLKILKIEKCFQGWQFIMNDMALNNELTDIKVINFPNLASHNMNNQEFFIFAEFLKPGYHQILIYDPEIDRAFVKDFIVHLNQRDFVYPEYPFPVETPIQKIIPNMWKKWKDDSDEQLAQQFYTDLDSDEFEIEKFIKNPQDQNECLDILKSKMRDINIFQKSLMARSEAFPQISWVATLSFMDEVQQNSNFKIKQGNNSFSKTQIELSFIRATRNDKAKGLTSAMQRSELLDFIMRMAQQFTIMKYSAKEKVQDHLNDFFQTFIDPILNDSPILKHREIIRKSVKLNELLYDNNKALVLLFDQTRKAYGENKTFTRECSKIIFLGPDCLGDKRYQPSERKVFDCFGFSLMTINNEHKNMTKYDYLTFVEFQELLCRVALTCFHEYETVEWKVLWLLTLIFEHQYLLKNWDPDQIKLIDLTKIY